MRIIKSQNNFDLIEITDKQIDDALEVARKAHQETWILGGISGRMITTKSGYYGDGFIADFDTKANATHCAKMSPDFSIALLEEVKRLREDKSAQQTIKARHGWKEVKIDRKDLPQTHEKLSYNRDYMIELHELMGTELKSLQCKLDKAVEALEFYAENENWLCSADFQIGDSITTNDWEENSKVSKRKFVGGKHARQALKEIKGEK